PPFAARPQESWTALMDAHRFQAPPVLKELLPGAPAALSDLVAALLAKVPQARPASAQAVADALPPLAQGQDPAARPHHGPRILPRPALARTPVVPPRRSWLPWLAGGALAVLLVAAGLWFLSGDRSTLPNPNPKPPEPDPRLPVP